MSCSIVGLAWIDHNDNNIFDSNDTVLSGLDVFLYSLENVSVPIAFTTTDINGNYSFTTLDSAKTYLIKALIPSTYSLVLSSVGTNTFIQSHINPFTSYSKQLKCCENDIITLNIGVKKNIFLSISGITFFDCNGDSILNSTDSLINGVSIYLLDENHNELTSTISGLNSSNGYYEFTKLLPQNYIIKVVSPSDLSFVVQNISSDGSKINPDLGEILVSLTNTNINNMFIGFSGNINAFNKYCTSSSYILCVSKSDKC
ncbi:MAG: SdrD B-like domain-containing protein [Sarcina sp.]